MSRTHLKLLLLFCILLIWPGFLESANNIVTHLPGFEGRLPFYLETGYVTVAEVCGAQIFYYFVESVKSPKVDPLLIWLTGGPSCSSLTALTTEVGPLLFKKAPYNASEQTIPTFVSNPYSWTKVIPIVAEKIAEGNDAGQQPIINLKGYLAGNLVTDDEDECKMAVAYGFGIGMISYELFLAIRISCIGEESYVHRTKPDCAANLNIFDGFLKESSMDNVLYPASPMDFDPWKKTSGTPLRRTYLLERKYDRLNNPPPAMNVKCPSYANNLAYYWANNHAVREALHIKEGTVEECRRCNFDLTYSYSIRSSAQYHLNFTHRGHRALVYSGDLDMLVPFQSTTKWIRFLKLPVRDKWRSWHVDDQVAGAGATWRHLTGQNSASPCLRGGFPVNLFDLICRRNFIYFFNWNNYWENMT